jgi:hypothetical protein
VEDKRAITQSEIANYCNDYKESLYGKYESGKTTYHGETFYNV